MKDLSFSNKMLMVGIVYVCVCVCVYVVEPPKQKEHLGIVILSLVKSLEQFFLL